MEGNSYDILLVDGEAIRLELPASVEATVTEAPEALRGDTAGKCVKASNYFFRDNRPSPSVYKKDDVIKISTSDKSYLGRVN